MSTFAWMVLFFILAFFLYCSLYGALGAASEGEQHLGQLAWLVIIPRDPRRHDLPDHHHAAGPRDRRVVSSGAEIIGATAAVIWLSARIFRVGILMTGKRFNFVDVLRLARLR